MNAMTGIPDWPLIADDLISQAREEPDPVERENLLNQARAVLPPNMSSRQGSDSNAE